MSGDAKKQITAPQKFYPTDNHVEIKTGGATLTTDDGAKILLDTLAEASFVGKNGAKNEINVTNAYAWVETPAPTLDILLKNFVVTPQAGSVVMVYQNTRASNVYVLKGNAIILFKGTVANVGVGQQLTVMTTEVNTLIKIADEVKPLEDAVRTSPLFVKNNGTAVLASSSATGGLLTGTGAAGSGATLTGTVSSTGASLDASNSNGQVITVTAPQDEATVKGTSVDVEGRVWSDSVTKVIINEHEALLDSSTHSFVYHDLPLSGQKVDIVYRAYGTGGTIIGKGLLTVYVNNKDSKSKPKPTVTTYPLSNKDFVITSPKDNPYKTTDDTVRVDGTVPVDTVDHITINDYPLKSFASNGTKWHYFANKDTGNFNTGINLYTIKYYSVDDRLLYTSLFTIVKDDTSLENPTDQPTGSTEKA